MNRFTKLIVGMLLGISMMWSTGSIAQDASDANADAIHTVIQTQLEAFAADDAETAFALSTNAAQGLLGSPEALLDIVKEWYPPLYRYQKADFAPPEIEGDQALQILTITDSNNLVWIAACWIRQEEDGQWKVDGYELVETDSVVI